MPERHNPLSIPLLRRGKYHAAGLILPVGSGEPREFGKFFECPKPACGRVGRCEAENVAQVGCDREREKSQRKKLEECDNPSPVRWCSTAAKRLGRNPGLEWFVIARARKSHGGGGPGIVA